jgi:PAS domain S-box-containing protein
MRLRDILTHSLKAFHTQSIRTKILIPFVGIVLFMTLGSALFAYFISFGIRPNFSQSSLMVMIIVGVVFINIVVFVMYSVMIRNITSSLDILATVARRVGQGDMDQRIYIESSDEIGDLVRVFNQMVESLKASSHYLVIEKNKSEAIISCMPEGIIVTDTDNRLILANSRAEEIFNFSSDKLQGKILLEYITNEELSTHLKEDFSEESSRLQREVVIPDSEGKERTYALISSFMKYPHDLGHLGVITVIRDVTQDRELDELREGFLRTVTHELRTPLTSIIGFIELVQSTGDPLPDQKQKWLNIALNESSNLKEMIDDLLDLSQLKAGRVKITLSTIRVENLLKQLVHIFEPLAKHKNLDLQLDDVSSTLEIRVDLSKIRRVLVNLLSNAFKFTQEGHVKIGCEEKASSVVFFVSDTGIGLKEDETRIIFEKFRQIDYSSTRQYEGIGLGLSIVKQLVEIHGGEVWVDSVFGQGTTFFVKLPKTPGGL